MSPTNKTCLKYWPYVPFDTLKPQDNHQGWMAGISEKHLTQRSNDESSVSTLQSTEKVIRSNHNTSKKLTKKGPMFPFHPDRICSPTRLLDLNCVYKLPYTCAPPLSCKPCYHDYRGSGDCGRLWFNGTMLLQEGGHSTWAVGGANSWRLNLWLDGLG